MIWEDIVEIKPPPSSVPPSLPKTSVFVIFFTVFCITNGIWTTFSNLTRFHNHKCSFFAMISPVDLTVFGLISQFFLILNSKLKISYRYLPKYKLDIEY